MKQQKKILFFTVAMLAILVMAKPTSAAEQWHLQSTADVAGPGVMEAVLPAGLYFSVDNTGGASPVDLSLIGPDGNQRSFELYWKEDNSPRSVVLKSARMRLDKSHALLWEAASPKDLEIEQIRIEFSALPTMGTVTIEGKDSRGWRLAAENAALYAADGRAATAVEIKPAVYEQLRLSFKGYDREFRETPLPVKAVTLAGKSTAKDYAETVVELPFSDQKQEKTRTLSAVLPGSGLRIMKIALITEAPFQGEWAAGQEVVTAGELKFHELSSGTVTSIGKKALHLEIPVNRSWPGRSLVLKLTPANTFVGSVSALRITVNLPRIVFYADKAGPYRVQTGAGNTAPIKDNPGDAEREIDKILFFSPVRENKQWAPEGLSEKYAVAGGPFNEKGFSWKAQVKVSEAGYYRLVLNEKASLLPHAENVRLVRDSLQVPFFPGQSEEKEIDLEAVPSYDQAKNRSSWMVTLPATPQNLKEMILESEGIFDRNVVIELPKHSRGTRQTWKAVRWANAAKSSTKLRVRLAGLPGDASEMRVSMEHGDNRPINIKSIKAAYHAPTLLFLIHDPGDYWLFGGNREIAEAKYDLALVQAHLIHATPGTAVMGDIESFRSAGYKHRILEVFDDKSWGLYAVLGFVTIALMILIGRLFPKGEN